MISYENIIYGMRGIIAGILVTQLLRSDATANSPIPTSADTSAFVEDLGNGWSGRVIVLPTGERLFLGERYDGWKHPRYPVAVLLPPLPASPIERTK
jgi:hypothetical protein